MSIVVAKRYADALFQLANEKNNSETIQKELRTVQEVFQKNEKLATILNHQRINKDEKMKIVDDAYNSLNNEVVNLIKLLVERNIIESIVSVIEHFNHLYNEENGIAQATVYSVRPLTESETSDLEASFKKQFDKSSIRINNVVDPSVIGGVKIRVGNTIYDGSISGKLNRIKHNLVSVSK